MIIIVMGVAGSGKTTIGRPLAERLGWRFYDADAYHQEESIEKMRRGEGLTDLDRTAWLQALRELIETIDDEGRSAVLACSALKHAYRRRLRPEGVDVRFVYLEAGRQLIRERLEARTSHFAGADLLESQFQALEAPEQAAVVVAADQAPQAAVERIMAELGLERS